MLKPYFVSLANDSLALCSATGDLLTIPDPIPMRTKAPFRCYLLDNLRYGLCRKRAQALPMYPQVDAKYQLFLRAPEKSKELYELRSQLTWAPQNGVNHVSAYIHEAFPLNSYQWQLLRGILKRLQAETKAVGAQLVVLLMPVTYRPADPDFIVGGSLVHVFATPAGEFTFRAAEPADRLRAICADLDILLFDPTADFIRHVTSHNLAQQCWPDPNDRHFSALGHRILAHQIRQFLREDFPQLAME
jgi:hypothetical protein